MDQAEAMETILVEVVVADTHRLVLGGCHPAVISGCRRRISPGLTAASASDCNELVEISEKSSDDIVSAALEGGSRDNITVIVLDVESFLRVTFFFQNIEDLL